MGVYDTAANKLGLMVLAVNQVKAGAVLDVVAAHTVRGRFTRQIDEALNVFAASQKCSFIRCDSARAIGRLSRMIGSGWRATESTFMRCVDG